MLWKDTLVMALSSIRANKLRSSLTLVGIILGVASIIGVMTGISVVQAAMEEEMSTLGGQTFQVQKWPSGFNTDEDFRKAMKRPPVTVADAQAIRDHAANADSVGVEIWEFAQTARYRGQTTDPDVQVCGGDPQYSENNTHYIDIGRNLSEIDLRGARRVAVIGSALADRFFPYVDPIGRRIEVGGREYEIVGVFAPKSSAFGAGFDNYVLIPYTVFQQVYGMIDKDGFPRSVNVTVHARSPELLLDAIEETRQVLRRVRHVKPSEEDNFAFFSSQSLIDNFNEVTRGVKIGAFVLGFISLIVAGVGIMNIMLVSVTERTKEIGIRKAIGARRQTILRQFLLEAVILCNVGGLVGVAVGFGLGNIVAAVTSFDVSVPVEWAVIGLLFCSMVGVGFGLLPAIRASRLDPIEALRYE